MPGYEFESDEIMSCERRVRTSREAIRDDLKLWGKDGAFNKGRKDEDVSHVNTLMQSLSSVRDRVRFVKAFFEMFEVYTDTGRMPVIMPVEEAGVESRSVKISHN